MLGGAATYIGLSASFFHPVKLVAVVGDDFAQEDYRSADRAQIDLAGLERVPGKTFFWEGEYSHDMNDRETLRTDLNVFADFDPKLPDSYQDAEYRSARQYPAAVCRRASVRQMKYPAVHRRRHDELLDQRLSANSCSKRSRNGISC